MEVGQARRMMAPQKLQIQESFSLGGVELKDTGFLGRGFASAIACSQ